MKRMLWIFLGLLVLVGILLLLRTPPEQTTQEAESRPPTGRIQLAVKPFALNQVRLLDGPFKRAMELDRRYVLGFEPESLLHWFRVTAGLESKATPLGGWSSSELRGHFVGHYLTAAALLYSATGEEEFRRRTDFLVGEMARCQEANGNGYLSAFPEEFFDRLEAREPVWAPWYTLHKIYAGLLDVYLHCGNKQALQVLEGMAAWAKNRTDRLTEAEMQETLETEFGGMNDVFAKLYEVTDKPDHLVLAKRFDHKRILDPLAEGRDELTGLHANTQIPKFTGAAQEFEVTGDPYYQKIATFSWETITQHRSFATGGTSSFERWRTDPDQLAAEVSSQTAETCCSYNLLKLTRHLFTWKPDARYADYYERALYNAILASQHPERGMMLYFCSMQPGHWKIFNPERDAFWCCTGTGIESHAKYGDSIYFHDDSSIYVNLYIPSEVSWEEKGLTLRQETAFPEEGSITLIVSASDPQKVAIHLRIPYWVAEGVEIKVNGAPQAGEFAPQSYFTVDRAWSEGDKLELTLPMNFHLARLPDDDNLAAMHGMNPRANHNLLYHSQKGHLYELSLSALMYGPLVLAGRMGDEGLGEEVIFPQNQTDRTLETYMDPPDLFIADWDPNQWIERVEGEPLAFRTRGVGQPNDVDLIPFYKLYDERYNMYWILIKKKQPDAVYLKHYD